MTITDQQLKGNWGEQYIASKLASVGCLVRQVTQGHDSGIDLYCEKVMGGKPYLHFWCQIKTSHRWKGKAVSIKFSPTKKGHIDYWLNQPIPVFIFLVPDNRNVSNPPYYISRALDFQLHNSHSISSYKKIESIDQLRKFVDNDLPFESCLWDLKEGKVSPLKKPTTEYTVYFPEGGSQVFEPKLRQSILWILHRLSNDMIFGKDDPNIILPMTKQGPSLINRRKNAKPYLNTLETLALSIKDEHYQNYQLLGEYYELEGDLTKAKKFYKQALNILVADSNIDLNNSPWNEIWQTVNGHMQRLQIKNAAKRKLKGTQAKIP